MRWEPSLTHLQRNLCMHTGSQCRMKTILCSKIFAIKIENIIAKVSVENKTLTDTQNIRKQQIF